MGCDGVAEFVATTLLNNSKHAMSILMKVVSTRVHSIIAAES